MVKLTVFTSAGDFDLSGYMNVDKRFEYQSQYFYSNTDLLGATLYSNEYLLGKHGPSPLFFGHATIGANGEPGFAPDGEISGMIGDKKLSDWLEGRDLADYTPATLEARIFVGDDTLRGNVGDDRLDGHAGADMLFGRGGDDVLIGGVGSDVLTGGFGADTLIGGFGADRFVYRQLHDMVGGTETITDFSHADGDKIDLTLFDASMATAGQQGVSFIGEAAFSATGAAEVRVDATSAQVNTLQFDVNGDGKIDGSVTVNTATVLDASDVETGAAAARVDARAIFGDDTVAVLPVHTHEFLHAELGTGHLA